ncbi:MAG TPA: hypothetical protein VMB50_21235 [Myxococcales bacterium]|jgi:membrane peptidoglycan carboxypeptidase|nr:hypothetical protein [Myxococcales bacterium]
MTDVDLTKLDRRVLARMLRKGTITEKELEKALKALPDQADAAKSIETTFEETAGKGLELEGR